MTVRALVSEALELLRGINTQELSTTHEDEAASVLVARGKLAIALEKLQQEPDKVYKLVIEMGYEDYEPGKQDSFSRLEYLSFRASTEVIAAEDILQRLLRQHPAVEKYFNSWVEPHVPTTDERFNTMGEVEDLFYDMAAKYGVTKPEVAGH